MTWTNRDFGPRELNMKMSVPITAVVPLTTTPLRAQDQHWQQSGYDWPGAVDLSADVDGDGLADAIIGDELAGSGGAVTVRAGAAGASLYTISGPAGREGTVARFVRGPHDVGLT